MCRKQSVKSNLSTIVLKVLEPMVPFCKLPPSLSKFGSNIKLKSPPMITCFALMCCEKEFKNSNRSADSLGKYALTILKF